MQPTTFMRMLTIWMWLNILAAAAALWEVGPEPRFWFLLVASAATWASLSIFARYFAHHRG